MGIDSKIKQTIRITILFVLITLSFFTSCNKSSTYVWLSYDETQCADAWPSSGNNETLKQNIVEYFEAKGITVYDSEIFVKGDSEHFNTCSSKSGRIIKCKIKEQKVSDMKSYGFYE